VVFVTLNRIAFKDAQAMAEMVVVMLELMQVK